MIWSISIHFMSTSLNAQLKSDHRTGMEYVVNVFFIITGMDPTTISETWMFWLINGEWRYPVCNCKPTNLTAQQSDGPRLDGFLFNKWDSKSQLSDLGQSLRLLVHLHQARYHDEAVLKFTSMYVILYIKKLTNGCYKHFRGVYCSKTQSHLHK